MGPNVLCQFSMLMDMTCHVRCARGNWTLCHRRFPEQQKLQQRQKGKWQKLHSLFQGTAGKWRWNSCWSACADRDGKDIANSLSKRLAMVGSSIQNVKDFNLRRQGLSSQLPQALVYEGAVQVDITVWSWRAEDDGSFTSWLFVLHSLREWPCEETRYNEDDVFTVKKFYSHEQNLIVEALHYEVSLVYLNLSLME